MAAGAALRRTGSPQPLPRPGAPGIARHDGARPPPGQFGAPRRNATIVFEDAVD